MKLCALITEKIEHKCNENVVRLNVTLKNDGGNNTVWNITFELFVDIENIIAAGKICLPDSQNDQNYGLEYFRTSVDASKMSKSLKGNALMRVLTESILKSINFDLKFPLKKV